MKIAKCKDCVAYKPDNRQTQQPQFCQGTKYPNQAHNCKAFTKKDK